MQKLRLNKFINGVWAANGSARLNIREIGNVCIIKHDDLEHSFRRNELVSDDTR